MHEPSSPPVASHRSRAAQESPLEMESRPMLSLDSTDIELGESTCASRAQDDAEKALLPRNESESDLPARSSIRTRSSGWWPKQPSLRSFQNSRFANLLNGARSQIPTLARRSSNRRQPSEAANRPRRARLFQVVRTIFNYPSPDFKARKTAWLDALRGLAAFNVFIYHWAEYWIAKEASWGDGPDNNPRAWWAAPFLRSWYDAGNAAVCLFFAISGYVLSYRILGLIRQQKTEEILAALSSAVLRRGIRLYMPIYLLTLVLMTWAYWTGLPLARSIELQSSYWRELARWYDELTHLWMPLRYPDRWMSILNPYDGTISWTIPLEYYGSITVYTGLLLTSKITSFGVRGALFAVLIYMYTVKDEWYVVQFLLGAIYAEYHLSSSDKVERGRSANTGSNPPSQRRRWGTILFKSCMVLALIFGIFLGGMPGKRLLEPDHRHQSDTELEPRPFYDWLTAWWVPKHWYQTRQVDRYFWSFAANCILVACGELHVLQSCLNTRPCQWLGKLSFGLYLCHMSVRGAMKPLDAVFLNIVGLDGSAGVEAQTPGARYAIAYFMRMVVAAPVNLFVAGLFERWMDRPSVSMGRRFEKFVVRIGCGNGESLKGGQATIPSNPDSREETGGTAIHEIRRDSTSLRDGTAEWGQGSSNSDRVAHHLA